MLLDAIVLAGGRSSRLSGVPKAQLHWHGVTLLQNTVDAALHGGARFVVVVGPDALVLDAHGSDAPVPDARVRFTREDPPFGGPAAAIGAGMRALDGQQAPSTDAADVVLVLACDMPEIARAVSALVESLPLAGSDGALLVDPSGMRQPLAAVYGRRALTDAVERLRASGTLDGASMRSLIASLDVRELTDAAGSTSDVDTWPDAAAFGIEPPRDAPSPRRTIPATRHPRRAPEPEPRRAEESSMSDDQPNDTPRIEKPAKPARSPEEQAELTETLERWSASLARELEIADLEVDIDAVLALAGVAARAVLRPAAPLTTYLVGYAAGRAAALGEASGEQATARAAGIAAALARSLER